MPGLDGWLDVGPLATMLANGFTLPEEDDEGGTALPPLPPPTPARIALDADAALVAFAGRTDPHISHS